MSAARYDRDLLERVLSRTGRRRGETVATLALLDAYPAERLPDTTEQEPERDTLIVLVEGLGHDPATASASRGFERAEVLDYLARDAESWPYKERRTLDAAVDVVVNSSVIIRSHQPGTFRGDAVEGGGEVCAVRAAGDGPRGARVLRPGTVGADLGERGGVPHVQAIAGETVIAWVPSGVMVRSFRSHKPLAEPSMMPRSVAGVVLTPYTRRLLGLRPDSPVATVVPAPATSGAPYIRSATWTGADAAADRSRLRTPPTQLPFTP